MKYIKMGRRWVDKHLIKDRCRCRDRYRCLGERERAYQAVDRIIMGNTAGPNLFNLKSQV